VLAAPADIAFLSSYLGSWRGRGTLKTREAETVVCTLNLSEGNADRVNFRGNCAMAGNTIAIQGTIAYNDSARRYEAAMTATGGMQGTAIGRRQGNGVVFTFNERVTSNGMDMNITSTMNLQSSGIGVEFRVATADGNMTATIPFTK
jgi:hypothetical protein